MEKVFNNPGLCHVAEMIFEELDHKSLETCSNVCHGWKNILEKMLENPRTLLKICIKRAPKNALTNVTIKQWKKLIVEIDG